MNDGLPLNGGLWSEGLAGDDAKQSWERIHFEYIKFEISKHQVEMSNKQLYVQVCSSEEISRL